MTGNNILWERGEIVPKEQFLLLSTIFSIYLQLQESNYKFICVMWLFVLFYFIYFFLNSANLICRGPDILNYFRESLGLPETVSRLNLAICRTYICP